MADVFQPIGSLPGAAHQVPAHMMCDDHPDRPAVHRVQGETDSFGAEVHDMCEECHAHYLAEKAKIGGGAFVGMCSRCGSGNVPLFAWRDYDEGMSGPVYYNCRHCKTEIVRRMNDDAADELAESRYAHDDYFDFDDGDIDDEPVWDLDPMRLKCCIRYRGSNQYVRNRDGSLLIFGSWREADNYMRRHKGKLRGRRLVPRLQRQHAGR